MGKHPHARTQCQKYALQFIINIILCHQTLGISSQTYLYPYNITVYTIALPSWETISNPGSETFLSTSAAGSWPECVQSRRVSSSFVYNLLICQMCTTEWWIRMLNRLESPHLPKGPEVISTPLPMACTHICVRYIRSISPEDSAWFELRLSSGPYLYGTTPCSSSSRVICVLTGKILRKILPFTLLSV